MQVHALLADRLAMVADADSRVDWAMAEALAFGTLLLHRCELMSVPCCCLSAHADRLSAHGANANPTAQ